MSLASWVVAVGVVAVVVNAALIVFAGIRARRARRVVSALRVELAQEIGRWDLLVDPTHPARRN